MKSAMRVIGQNEKAQALLENAHEFDLPCITPLSTNVRGEPVIKMSWSSMKDDSDIYDRLQVMKIGPHHLYTGSTTEM